jgi:hypothetical protein
MCRVCRHDLPFSRRRRRLFRRPQKNLKELMCSMSSCYTISHQK